MADTLADILNRVSADPQGVDVIAAPANNPVLAPWALKLWDTIGRMNEGAKKVAGAIDTVAASNNPFRSRTIEDVRPGKAIEDARMNAGQIARIPTDVAGAVVSLPNLPDTLSQLAGGPAIGRVDALDNAAESIHETGQQVGEAIAGRPLNDSLVEGTPSELTASWARLLTGAAIPVKMPSALQKISAGTTTAGRAVNAAATTMEVLTPLTLNPKAVVPNVVAASVITPALELTIKNNEQAKSQIEQNNEQAKGALEIAAEGAKEARSDAARVIQAGILPSTGNDVADIALAGTVLGAAVLAGSRFNMMGRALRAQKQADPLDWTRIGRLDRAETQASDRTLPMWKTVGDVARNQKNTSADVIEMKLKEDIASRQGMSSNMRQIQWYTDGTLPDSAIKTNPGQNLFLMYKRLPPDEQQLAIRGLISKREISTRNILKQWNDLSDIDSRELGRIVAQAEANPRVSLLMKEYKTVMQKFADYTAEQAAFTKGEVKAFKSQNPEYVATRKVGSDSRWLSPRNVTASNQGFKTFEEMGNPFELLPQYIDEVIRSTEGKKIKRDVLIPLIKARDAGDTVAKQVIGHTILNAPPSETKGLYVHWRNPVGESRWTRIHDSYLRASLHDVTNPTALQLYKGLGDIIADAGQKFPLKAGLPLNLLRSSSQQNMAVGFPAAITGSPFAPTSLSYTAGSSSVMRPASIASGPIDKFLQERTQDWFGKKIGLPGSGILEMPFHVFNAAEGVRAVIMQRGAQALNNSIMTQGPLSRLLNTLGPNAAKATADGLATAYKRHAAYDLRQSGIMGPSTYMSVDPSLAYRNPESMVKSGMLKETAQFTMDLIHAMTSAPALTMYKSNKEMLNDVNTKARLMNAIRTMSGDPGASGLFGGKESIAGRGLAHTVNSFPWANSGIIQPSFRLIRSFRENPSGTVAGIFNYAVLPAIATTLWNASAGSDYSDHQFNIRPPDRVSSHLYIASPGQAPDQGSEYPIDPAMRPFKLMGELLAGHILGAANGELFKEENAAAWKAIRDSQDQRWGLGGSVLSSMFSQSVMPPVPNVVQLPLAMAGVPINDWVGGSTVRSEKVQQGFTEGTGSRGQMFMHMYGPAWLEDAVRALGATAGTNILHMLDDTLTARYSGDMGRGEENASWKEALQKGVTGNMKQNLTTSVKTATPLFDSYLSISPSKEASATVVQDKLNGLRKFSQAYQSATDPGGTPQLLGNKKVGQSEYSGVPSMQARDEITQLVGREAQRIYQELSANHEARIKALYEDRNSIAQSNKFSPTEKRGKMNAIAVQIIESNRAMLADIERQESALSDALGVPIKFDKLNLNKGGEQFK